jgi:hypothetical protein
MAEVAHDFTSASRLHQRRDYIADLLGADGQRPSVQKGFSNAFEYSVATTGLNAINPLIA